jgi:hypothetical protein
MKEVFYSSFIKSEHVSLINKIYIKLNAHYHLFKLYKYLIGEKNEVNSMNTEKPLLNSNLNNKSNFKIYFN